MIMNTTSHCELQVSSYVKSHGDITVIVKVTLQYEYLGSSQSVYQLEFTL